jgi:hypothetical protein
VAKSLAVAAGVEQFHFVDDVRIAPEQQTIGGQQLVVYVEHHELGAFVTFNERVVSVLDLAGMISAGGFVVAPAEVVGQVGKDIVVPPDVVG